VPSVSLPAIVDAVNPYGRQASSGTPSYTKFPQDVLVRNPLAAPVSAGRFDLFKHLRIDGGFIVRQEELQIARRRCRFRFREPVDQFVKLLFAHPFPPMLQVYSMPALLAFQ
jgi:hypothetical protein